MKRYHSELASTGHGTGALQELSLRRRLENLKRHRRFAGVGYATVAEAEYANREKGPATKKPGDGYYARLRKAWRAWQRAHADFMLSIELPLCLR